MIIFIQTTDNVVLPLFVDVDDRIINIKRKIDKMISLRAKQQKIIHAGEHFFSFK